MSPRKVRLTGISLVEVLAVAALLAILTAIILPVYNRVKAAGYRTTCLANMRQLGLAVSLYASSYDLRLPTNTGKSVNDPPLAGLPFDGATWFGKIAPYAATEVGDCPLFVRGDYSYPPPPEGRVVDPIPGGYAINGCLKHMERMGLIRSDNVVLFTETSEVVVEGSRGAYPLMLLSLTGPDQHVYRSYPEPVTSVLGSYGATRHMGGANYVLLDLSAKWYRPEQTRLPSPGAGCNWNGEHPWEGPIDAPRFGTTIGDEN